MWSCGVGRGDLRRSSRRAVDVHRRDAGGRHSLSAQQRRVREEVPARDAGIRLRVRGRRQRRLAGHLSGQLEELAGPAGCAVVSRALSQQSQRYLHRYHAAGGPCGRDIRDGRLSRRLRQRWQRRSLRDRRRSEPPVQKSWQRQIRGRHRKGRRRRSGIFHERDVVRLRQGRPAGSRRGALRRLDAGERPALLAGREDEVVLHAGVVQGRERDALSQPRQRHVRERDAQGRALRSNLEEPRAGHARLRRRRLDGSLRRERHAAEQVVQEQEGWDVRGRRYDRGCRVQRGRRREGRDGSGRGRLRRIRQAQPGHRQLLERDDRALHQSGQRPVHRRCPLVHDWEGLAPHPDVCLLLLRRRSRRSARRLCR